MTAACLEELAERLMHGEYTTADLHAAARCARGWEKVGEAENPSLERWDWPQGTKWYFRATGLRPRSGATALEAVEEAEVKL